MQTSARFWSYIGQFFLEWEMFQPEIAEKIETHIFMFDTVPPPRIVPFMR